MYNSRLVEFSDGVNFLLTLKSLPLQSESDLL